MKLAHGCTKLIESMTQQHQSNGTQVRTTQKAAAADSISHQNTNITLT